jgi:predicted nucleic acid-binding protein
VLNELYVILTRKLPNAMSAHDAWDIVESLFAWNPQPLDRELLVLGRQVEERYRLSWWDSLIVAAAQLQDCDILLSEDLQSGMKLGRVIVRNPFDFGVQEPRAVYEAPDRFELRHRPRGRPRKTRPVLW